MSIKTLEKERWKRIILWKKQPFNISHEHSLLWKIGKSPSHYIYPLVMTNIAMENGPFIDDFPIYR